MYKNTTQLTILDQWLAKPATRATIKLSRIDQSINWIPIKKILSKHYLKGTDIQGRHAYAPLLLFKICLLQTWYGLSDEEIEDCMNDRLSFMNFCGMSLNQPAP